MGVVSSAPLQVLKNCTCFCHSLPDTGSEMDKYWEPNVFLDSDFVTPPLFCRTPDFSTIVLLGGNTAILASIPLNVADWKDHSTRNPDRPRNRNTGAYVEMDEGRVIDWFSRRWPWRGFGLRNDAGTPLPAGWFFGMDIPGPLEWLSPTSCVIAHRDRYLGDVRKMDRVIYQLAAVNHPRISITHRPLPVDGNIITRTFPTAQEAQAAYADFKRAARDRVAWLRWYLTTLSDREALIPADLLSKAKELACISIPSVGFIVDLAQDCDVANFRLWIGNDVPVAFFWSKAVAEDPRFSRLNPFLIAAACRDADRAHPFHIVDSPGWSQACFTSHLYDDFLQLKQYRMPECITPIGKLDVWVIDFQNWRRRRITANQSVSEYLKRFQKRVVVDVDHEVTEITFYRWKPFFDSDVVAHDRNTNSPLVEDYEDLDVLRELTRESNAPQPGMAFHPELGTELDGALAVVPETGRRSLSASDMILPIIDEVAEEDLDASMGEASSISSFSTGQHDLFQRLGAGRPSLLDRLGGLSIPSGLSTAPSLSPRIDLERPVSPAESSVYALPEVTESDRAHSTFETGNHDRAPVPPLQEHAFVREARMFLERLDILCPPAGQDLACKINPLLIERGILMIEQPYAEVQLRYMAMVFPQLTSFQLVLAQAIVLRLPFNIAVKSRDLELFRPPVISESDRLLAKTLYNENRQDLTLEHIPVHQLVGAWLSVVGDILRREHARCFIGIGGTASWLAERFGGPHLVEAFIGGPSLMTTLHKKGGHDSHLLPAFGSYWDKPLANEVALLHGYIHHEDHSQSRWLFPPPEVLVYAQCSHWFGSWNAGMESIYSYLADGVLREDPDFTARTKSGWKDWLWTYSCMDVRADDRMEVWPVPMHEFNSRLLSFPRAGLRPTWHHYPIFLLNIPECPSETD